ncbi:MAG: hypothetical protein C0446_00610 [Chitinophaga sp.]|nr:hypothetical protein [Chitinophaga sp.]
MNNSVDDCSDKFKNVKDIASLGSTRQSALDSALSLCNEVISCSGETELQKTAIDFKIRLIINLRKFSEGVRFIDSLPNKSFVYEYKKDFLLKSLIALNFISNNDTAKLIPTYKQIVSDLENYVQKKSLDDKEFKEVYSDLFSVKQKFLSAKQINEDVKLLKRKFPQKQTFFEFFVVDEDSLE